MLKNAHKWDNMLNFDIAIVGGSIAGLSAAREISRGCDANLVVIEDHNEIGHPALSSAFTFVDTVNRYGLTKAVKRYYTKVGMFSFLGGKVVYEFTEPKLAVLDYTKTCKELLLNSKKSNIEILTSTKASRLLRTGKKIALDLTGMNECSLKCDLLIDASGASFFSARFASLRIPTFYSQPYGYELENCDIPDDFLDQLSFFVGRSIGTGGGWFYPITKSVCRFGIAEIARTPSPPRYRLEKYYDFANRNMQPFSNMIKNAKPCALEAGPIPAEPMRDLVLDNIVRVGDSAGHATPHMLEGIRPSIESATLCGKISAKAYEKQDFSKSFLRNYEQMWHRQNKLLYLYLLSMAEVAFAYDDRKIEESIRLRASSGVDSDSYLRGIRGEFRFPSSLFSKRPDINHLKFLLRFIYHNVIWLLR